MRVATQQMPVPPDPSMVEFDLTEREFPELALDSMEELEEIETLEAFDDLEPVAPRDPPPPVRRGTLPPAPARQSRVEPAPPPVLPSMLELPLPPSPMVLLGRMGIAFVGALLVTMALVLVPWFALIAPQIDRARESRRPAPQIVQVPVPAPAPAVVAAPAPPVEPEVVEPEVVEPEVVEPEVVEPAPVVAAPAPVRPVANPAPVARPQPVSPRPARPAPEPAPAPEPVVVRPGPAPAPAPAPLPPPGPVVQASVKARALAGRMSGTAGDDDVTLTLRFLGEGKLLADIVRAGKPVSAAGSYTMDDNDATFVLVEKGGAATYSGKVTADGINGRVSTQDGNKGKLKVRR